MRSFGEGSMGTVCLTSFTRTFHTFLLGFSKQKPENHPQLSHTHTHTWRTRFSTNGPVGFLSETLSDLKASKREF